MVVGPDMRFGSARLRCLLPASGVANVVLHQLTWCPLSCCCRDCSTVGVTLSSLASGTSVREVRFMGEATASIGRRYQKALHNHPRKLIGTLKGGPRPTVTPGPCGKSPEAAVQQADGTMNLWPVKILWHVIHRRRIRVRRRTRAAMLWDEDNARRGLGKRRSRL